MSSCLCGQEREAASSDTSRATASGCLCRFTWWGRQWHKTAAIAAGFLVGLSVCLSVCLSVRQAGRQSVWALLCCAELSSGTGHSAAAHLHQPMSSLDVTNCLEVCKAVPGGAAARVTIVLEVGKAGHHLVSRQPHACLNALEDGVTACWPDDMSEDAGRVRGGEGGTGHIDGGVGGICKGSGIHASAGNEGKVVMVLSRRRR